MPDQPEIGPLPDVVPVFPLPNLVMFPHAVLPLHIFEMRYRAMTRDALAGPRLIAMATLAPGYEPDYDGNPGIWPVGCLGRIIDEERLPDGRFNFLLHGVARIRFGLELPSDPYRRAKFEVLADRPADAAHTTIMRQALGSLYELLAENDQVPVEPLARIGSREATLGETADLIAHALAAEPKQKQELLEELDVGRRAVKVAALLQGRIQSLGLRPHRRRLPGDPNLN